MELMVLIVVVPLILILASLVLIYHFKLYAVLVCSLIAAAYAGFVSEALRGFGSPTGNVPAFNFGQWLGMTLWALLPISLSLLAFHYLLRMIKNESSIWPLGASGLCLLAVVLLYRYPPNTWYEAPEDGAVAEPETRNALKRAPAARVELPAALVERYRRAMDDAGQIPEFLEFTRETLEAKADAGDFAFEIADFTTKLLIDRLRAQDLVSAAQVFNYYSEIFLPRTGWSRKTEDVASMGLALSLSGGGEAVAQTVFDELLPVDFEIESLDNPVLLFNLASYYARQRDEANLMRAARHAIAQGKKAANFLNDPDFAAYVEDAGFRAVIGAEP